MRGGTFGWLEAPEAEMPAEGMPVAQINRGGFIVPPGPKSLGGVYCLLCPARLMGGVYCFPDGVTVIYIYLGFATLLDNCD